MLERKLNKPFLYQIKIKIKICLDVLHLPCKSKDKIKFILFVFIPMNGERIESLLTLLPYVRTLPLARKYLSGKIADYISTYQDFRLLRRFAVPIIQNQDTSYIYKPILTAFISSNFREKCANIVADLKNELFQYSPKSNGKFPLVQTINNGGIHDFGQLLTANQIDEIHEYLKDQPLANVHYHDYGSRSYSFSELLQTNSPYGSYSRDVALNCPHILSIIFADDIVDSIAAYLGTVPTISSINLFWTFKQDFLGPVSRYHRDVDDVSFVNLLIYLVDINEMEDGPHQYVKNSANFDYVSGKIKSINVNLDSNIFFDHLWPENTVAEIFDEEIQEVFRPAGTALANNSYCLHRGVPPKSKPRLALSIIYSVLALKDHDAYTKFELPQHINLNQRNKILSDFLFTESR